MASSISSEAIARQNAMVLAASVGLCDGMVVYRDAAYGREVGVVIVGEAVGVETKDGLHYNAVDYTGPNRSAFPVWKGATVERLGPDGFEAAMSGAEQIVLSRRA